MPSRDTKARTADLAVDGQPAVRPEADAADSAEPGRPQRASQLSRRSLKNWRVRSRLLLLITIPTLTAVILGGTYIVTSVQNALNYQRVETLANLSYDVTSLAAHLEDERDQTVEYLGEGNAGRSGTLHHDTADGAPENLQLVHQEQQQTTPWIAKVRTDSAAIGAGYPSQVREDAANIGDVLKLLGALRTAATTTQLPAVEVMTKYTSMIDELTSIDDDIALGSGDPVLNNDVRALNLMSLIAEEASEQRGLLAYAFAQDGKFNPTVLNGVTTALEEQEANVAEYDRVATPQQVTLYNNTVAGPAVDFASNYELQAIQYGEDGESLTASPITADNWWGDMTIGTIGGMRAVEQDLVVATIARASDLRRSAIETASVVGGSVLLVLLLALLLTTFVGRSMVRPLRRLRSGALEVAGVRLPETVRRMSESDGVAIPLDVEPIDVDSSDEIGEVARAFDQVHREALRLASNEAALRGNVNAMFVNLSRRSQSLVERQIRLIDDLEQGEEDADRLSSLFQMDHLATRMRRNSENLLVLAGHDGTRRWNQPVSLVDVLRAAVSEIEQYERVTLNVQPGIAVRGHAVNDVVHLLAELAENATSFSSAETPVVVAGHLLTSGGVLLDITDQGVGMGAEEMAHANWRLDNPPVVDVAVSRRMGLFVVARLAARHGIRVRLRPAAAGGLTALVWLPDEVVSNEAGGDAPGMRGFELPAGGADAAAGGAAVAGAQGRFNLALNRNGNGNGDSLAEQEINAARAPRFAGQQSEQAAESALGPRRVPGAGLHPGNLGWGGAATTSPLPAVGSEAAEAGLAAAAAGREDMAPRSYQPDDTFASAPMSADTTEFRTTQPSVQPVVLGQPSVTGRAAGTSQARPELAGSEAAGPAGAGLTGAGLTGPEMTGAGKAGAGPTSAELAGGTGERPVREQSGDRNGRGWDNEPAAAAARQPDRAGNGTAATANGGYGPGGPLGSGSSVIVPPAEHVATENRLPIFEAVESDWFRRGRSGVAAAGMPSPATPAGTAPGLVSSPGAAADGPAGLGGPTGPAGFGGPGDQPDGWPSQQQQPVQPELAPEPEVTWAASAADEGWEAASAVSAPSTGGTTSAGLPKRVPQANLVPGTASQEPIAPAPARSAAATRDRFTSFQRGIREGRAAVSGDDGHSDGDDGSR